MTFLIWMAVALGALLIGDGLVTWWVRREAARRLEGEIGASVEVDVRGWPGTLRLPLGRLRAVTLRARDVTAGRANLRVLEVELHGVRPSLTDGDGWRIASNGGTFTARLDRDGFRDLAPLPDAVVDVRLVDDRVRFELPGGVTVPASVRIEDDVVVLIPELERLELLSVLRIAFPIEELPFGASVDEVQVVEGGLIVRGTVGALEVGPD